MKRLLFNLLRLLLLSALGGAAWVAHRAETLPELPAAAKPREQDVLEELRLAAIKRATAFEISEADINRHLAAVMPTRIGSRAEGWFRLQDTRVELEEGRAHVVIVWDVRGLRRTASIDLTIRREAENYHVEVLHGAIGHLRLPRGMMRVLDPTLRVITDALDAEIKALFQMTQITFGKDKLLLDSRFTSA